MTQEGLETAANISAKVTYTGAGGAVWGGLSANELAAFGGLLIAAIGLIANIVITIYYKRKSYQLLQKHYKDENFDGESETS